MPTESATKDRHPAGALRNEFTLRTHEPHRQNLCTRKYRAEGGARNVGIDLIRDRDQTVTNHLESDRVDEESLDLDFVCPLIFVALLDNA
jgi:hypothetical protein